MKKLVLAVLLTGVLASARADIVPFTLTLDGSNAGTGSPATGSGLYIAYDTDTQILSLVAGYGSGTGGIDLVGDFTVSHIHNADTSVFQGLDNLPFPGGSTKSGLLTGTIDYSGSASAQAELLSGVQYVNVHSSTNPGGEISGNLTPVPEPTVLALAGLGISSLLIFRGIADLDLVAHR